MSVSSIGYLYLIESYDQKLAKIGHGANPKQRRHQLQTGNPARLTLLAALPAPYPVERAVHEALAGYKAGLEWFKDIGLMRDIFCALDQEIADLDFEHEPAVLSVASVGPIIKAAIEWRVEYERQYGPPEIDPPRELFIQCGTEWWLPTADDDQLELA